jgi:hypothetical protein
MAKEIARVLVKTRLKPPRENNHHKHSLITSAIASISEKVTRATVPPSLPNPYKPEAIMVASIPIFNNIRLGISWLICLSAHLYTAQEVLA